MSTTTEKIQSKIKYKQPELLVKILTALSEKKTPEKIDKLVRFNLSDSKNPKLPKLSQKTIELGLTLLNAVAEYRTKNQYWSHGEEITKGSKRHEALKKKFDLSKLWEGAHRGLLDLFFGKTMAVEVKNAWDTIPNFMYQTGWVRRSFRRPNDPETTQLRQLNFIIGMMTSASKHPFSLKESVRYQNLLPYNPEMAFVWAEAINQGDDELYEYMIDIMTGDAENGQVSRNLIKALLLSEKPEAWEAVGKLLLAAQRQEGLRQTILETLDETSIGAMKYMVDLVLEHNLIRFSAVVRALDTWAGFNWDAEKVSTVKRFMELAQRYLNEPELIEKAIKSKDNAEVYMSLWALGVHDIDRCKVYLDDLYKSGKTDKKVLVLYFVSQTEIGEWFREFGSEAIMEKERELIYWGLQLLGSLRKEVVDMDKQFNRMMEIYYGMSEKEIVFSGKVFSWMTFVFKKELVGNRMILLTDVKDKAKMEKLLALFPDMPVSNRERLAEKILNKFYGYWGRDTKAKPSKFERDFAFSVLRDRSEVIRNSAFRALRRSTISEKELEVFEGLLNRKSADFRQQVIELILKRPMNEQLASAGRLVQAGNVDQRLAGLDLLNHLNKNEINAKEVKAMALTFSERKRIGRKEQVLLDNLLAEKVEAYTAENGYGLYDPKNVSTIPLPKKPTKGEFYKRQNAKHPHGLSRSVEAINEAVKNLAKLFLSHKDYEYEMVDYSGRVKEKVLLGNNFSKMEKLPEDASPRAILENYPLSEVWEKWYKDSKLTPFDLYKITFNGFYDNEDGKLKKVFPKTYKNIKDLSVDIQIPKHKDQYYFNRNISEIITLLQGVYPYEKQTEYVLDGVNHLLSLIDPSELGVVEEIKNTWGGRYKKTVFNFHLISQFLNENRREDFSDKDFKTYWNQLQFINSHINYSQDQNPNRFIEDFCRAYQLKACTRDEFVKALLYPSSIERLMVKAGSSWRGKFAKEVKSKFDFVQPILDECKKRILEVEFRRGDSATTMTAHAQNISILYGVENFVKIVNGLGKDNLNRGYIYTYGNRPYSKKQVLSSLLKNCYPGKTMTQSDFDQAVKAEKLSEKRLVEVALYAQQWLPFISNYLGWDGMESGAWWLHAHTNEDHNAQKETEIAKYSSIDMKSFQDGAVDYDWFRASYQELGKKRWKLLYDSAKYISEGTGHTRAKLYADVMTGAVKIREVTKRIKDKRNKDYVRVYGLVPLSKSTPEKDLLTRYNFLQQFKKESKQFGAQRQTSEGLAVQIALENLARTAGYPDPIRLTWAMETEEAKSIMSQAEALTFGEVTIQLVVDAQGQSSIIAKKSDKKLSSIPAKLRKDKSVLALKGFNKKLREQYRRSRKSLEAAMVRGDEFKASEVQLLMEHPVIAPMLSKLVLINEHGIGWYRKGKLESLAGKVFDWSDKIRIAHCTDLFQTKRWDKYQRYCFENELVQPFKQIFRELYVPTKDELQQKSISRRYAGHQVQPKKTVALLKTKGWTVDYEEGLQKVFHKEGFIAKIYAMADWFSPADVESPTLETVEFKSRKDYKNIVFKSINPRIFSEVMRDVDLVVSVAHVGGVDPEASHSTVEMRAAIIRETCRLFKLKNVKIDGHHAHIEGKIGEYSVHLGSGVTHQKPGRYLSILPVHSQHRGRLFLPFVDEDPKSAEVMSKILMLAKDGEIKDPTVLEQIR